MRLDKMAPTQLGRHAWLLLAAGLTCTFFCGLFAPAASAQFEALERTRPPLSESMDAWKHPWKPDARVSQEKRAPAPPLRRARVEALSTTPSLMLEKDIPSQANVDQGDFDRDGHLRTGIDIDEAQEIVVKFGDPSRPTRKASRIPSDRGPPLWGVELEPGLLFKMSNTADPIKFEQFGTDPFKIDKMQFVSFVHDTATEEAIRSASPLRDHLLEPLPDSLEKMRAEFKKHKGNTFLIMGHVEGGRFVAKDPTGQIKLVDISLQDINTEAAEIGCKVIVLGCHSASANVPVGVIQEFNPIDAVSRLNKAVQAQTDYAFYKTLASKDFSLLLDESVLTDRNGAPVAKMISFEIYSGLIPPERSGLTPRASGPKLIASGFLITPRAVPTPTPTPISAVPPSKSEIGLGDGNQRTSNQ
jgi:hypothetical protein